MSNQTPVAINDTLFYELNTALTFDVLADHGGEC